MARTGLGPRSADSFEHEGAGGISFVHDAPPRHIYNPCLRTTPQDANWILQSAVDNNLPYFSKGIDGDGQVMIYREWQPHHLPDATYRSQLPIQT